MTMFTPTGDDAGRGRRDAGGMRVLLLLLVALAYPASAAAAAPVLTNERPGGQLEQRAVTVGLMFWQARGVTGCGQRVTVSVADWIQVDGVQDVRGVYRPWLPCHVTVRTGLWPWEMCADVVHEVGHALGVPHGPSGVMRASRPVAPWECMRFGGPVARVRWFHP